MSNPPGFVSFGSFRAAERRLGPPSAAWAASWGEEIVLEPTVTAQLNRSPDTGSIITFVTDGSQETLTTEAFLDEARACAGRLQARGVGPGSHVALLGPTSRDLVTVVVGTWLAGGAVVVLPLPMRLTSLEAFVEATRMRVKAADLGILAVAPELESSVSLEPGDPEPILLSALVSGAAAPYEEPAPEPSDLAVLQFTSGSTGDPKGVMVPHRAMCSNIAGMVEASRLTPEVDKVMSWLPLYHDMGLIGFLGGTLLSRTSLVLGAPQDFLTRPRDWMQMISEHRATITGAPNSAYGIAARLLRRTDETFDLSSLRLALNGAEPIDPDVVDAFVEAGEAHKLSPSAPFCVYGLAEATLAVTFPEVGAGMETDEVDPEELEAHAIATPGTGRRLAKEGRPIPGIQIQVVGTEGDLCADRVVGEIEIRGDAVTPGYYKNPEATAEIFRGGWLRTGDLGYMVDGQLVVCGRIKDLIIVAGRNFYPEDIERTAARVDGVRQGNVVAFAVENSRSREVLVVVAETKVGQPQAEPLAKDVASAVRAHVGLPVHDVVLLPPGSLPKTSSGKLQRGLCRSRYVDGELVPVAALAGHPG